MEEETGGMVWRCNSAGKVLEIISSDFPDLGLKPTGFPFYYLLNEASEQLASQWFRQIGDQTVLLAPLSFKDDPQGRTFTLGGILAGGFQWLYWTTTPLPEESPSIPERQVSQETRKEEKGLWEPTPDQVELLEELSRVNNELVNARRELIRQNIELHRAHQKINASKKVS